MYSFNYTITIGSLFRQMNDTRIKVVSDGIDDSISKAIEDFIEAGESRLKGEGSEGSNVSRSR